MTTSIDPLVRDLVEWVAVEPRLYRDVMDAWKTSCPRLTVWEDAVDAGFVQREHNPITGDHVTITPVGHRFLQDTLAKQS